MMLRRLGCALAIVAIWWVVLALAAEMPWSAPPLPRTQLDFPARDFHVVAGAGAEDGDALRVGAVGDDGSALQTVAGSIDADATPLLRYRFEGFPRTLELSFVFRTAAAPDDVQTVTVPWPGERWRSIDLSKVPAWRGRILEVGFAEYPTPQVVPDGVAFRPFRFDGLALWSPSWRGSCSALATSWLGYTPWSLLSVSALGPQREVAQPPPLAPFALAGLCASLGIAALLLRWPRRVLLLRATLAFAALWVLLDLRWLDDLTAKHALTESVYAGKDWPERERLVPDGDIAAAAAQVRDYFAAHGAPQRLLVGADSKYTFLRLIWFLLPLNAAPLQQAPPGEPWPDSDTYVLLFHDSSWRYDAPRGLLLDAADVRLDRTTDRVFHDRFEGNARFVPVLSNDELRLYRVQPEAAP